MKKLLLLTLVLLAAGATAALAQDSMNLGYVCRTAANNATASTNDFSPVSVAAALGGTCNDGVSYTTEKHLTSTFKNATPMTQWGGCSVQIDIQTQPAPLPDFWAIYPGGCSDGMLDAPNTMSTVGITGCTNPYVLTPTDPAGQTETNGLTADVPSGRVHIKSFHIRASLGVDLAAATGSGYVANNFGMKADNAATCTGCADPACIVLNTLEYFSVQENRVVQTPDLRTWVTWNGGMAGCPGAVPTKTTTWGQVKALYR